MEGLFHHLCSFSIYHDKRVWVGRRGWRGCFIICVHFPFTMTREFGLAGEGGGVVSSSAEALVCTVFT